MSIHNVEACRVQITELLNKTTDAPTIACLSDLAGALLQQSGRAMKTTLDALNVDARHMVGMSLFLTIHNLSLNLIDQQK